MSQRTPVAVAAEARQHLDQTSKLFVPPDLVRLATLTVEFMETTAATLQAAGLITEPAPAGEGQG